MPIRARLTILSAALVGTLILAFGAFLFVQFRADLLREVDTGLRSRADILLQRSAQMRPPAGRLIEAEDAFLQVFTRDGALLESSPGLPAGPLLPRTSVVGLGDPAFFDVDVRTFEEVIPARILVVPDDRFVLVVGASLEDARAAIGRLLTLLLVGGPIAVALASGVGWLVAGAALRPVDRMRVEAEAVSGSEPGIRLHVPDTGDELARLGTSLNRMLERLEGAVEHERRFVDDASHEIRTPLTNLRAELELALSRSRTSAELVDAITSAKEETERLIRLAGDLLVLARADRGRLPVRRQEMDVRELLDETIVAFGSRASHLGVSIESKLEEGLRARVDGERLRQAVGNVIDNALRHTSSGGRVSVALTRHDGGLAIEIADDGEGFPPTFLPRAFEPFSRADAARGRADGGAGLGLAIVKAVASAHGGTVDARNLPDRGAAVVIRLPA